MFFADNNLYIRSGKYNVSSLPQGVLVYEGELPKCQEPNKLVYIDNQVKVLTPIEWTNHRIKIGEIILSDDVIHYIIENYCNKEDGVRNQKRCLEIIYTKLNLYRLMKPGSNLFEQDMSMEVKFPFQVTRQIVDKLIKMDKDSTHFRSMYV